MVCCVGKVLSIQPVKGKLVNYRKQYKIVSGTGGCECPPPTHTHTIINNSIRYTIALNIVRMLVFCRNMEYEV